MNTKNIFAFLIFCITALFLYSFVFPFKALAIDNVSVQLSNLQNAYETATKQLSLKTLRLKKQQLSEQDLALLQNFIPQSLHSGTFVYNLGQLANQNRLTLKSLQYTVIDDALTMPKGEKKLVVEFTMSGRYEDFTAWMQSLEKSNALIDIVSVRGTKNSNASEIITFNVKMYTYGIRID